METAVKKLYEGMFLVDSAEAARDWDGVIEGITKILNRAEAEIVSLRKWDERPLAYSIRRCNRGTYILTYFRAEGQKIRDIERDVLLSELVMRALILRADHITEEDIEKQSSAKHTETQERQPADKADSAEAEKEIDQEPDLTGEQEDIAGYSDENNPDEQGS